MIRDFGLNLTYVHDEEQIEFLQHKYNLCRSEAIKLDYQNRWKDKCVRFSLETRCIASFFARVYKNPNTKGCSKILVECAEEPKEKQAVSLFGICEVQVKFNYEDFVALDNYGKKKMTLELLMTGVRKAATDQGWDIEPFEQAYEVIKQADYNNEGTWHKKAKNRETKQTARIFLVHEVEKIDIYMKIEDKLGKEVYSKKIITEKPDEFIYARYLDEFYWRSNEEVVLKWKDGEFVVNLSKVERMFSN